MLARDVSVGMAVRVRRGYSTRPAVVERVYQTRVGVRFTDVTIDDVAAIPATQRAALAAATVHCSALRPA